MFFVATRFFFIALMPLIGFIVDGQVSRDSYIFMLHISMLLTGIGYILSFILRGRVIQYVENKLITKSDQLSSSIEFKGLSCVELCKHKKIIYLSSIVFCCYALGVFLAFYYASIFYEYRATIGQLSGVINGLATVLLTFIVEPLLAKEIDSNNPNAINMVYSLLLGRFIGVAIISHFIIMVV